MRHSVRATLAALVAVSTSTALAGALLQPIPASDWEVSEWVQGNPGSLASQQGKVVLLHFFQLWCPGSNEFSIPLFQHWAEKFAGREDVLLVGLHSVFEGHDYQTPERLREFLATKGIDYAVGIDAYRAGNTSEPITLAHYEAAGTPQVVIIDRDGAVRFSHFGVFDPVPVEAFIERLFKEKRGDSMSHVRGGSRGSGSKSAPPRKPRAPGAEKPRSEPSPSPAGGASEAAPRRTQDAQLSGSFRVNLELTEQSCGAVAEVPVLTAQLAVYSDSIEARFSRGLLGQRQVSSRFDPQGGTFSADSTAKAVDGGVPVDLHLTLNGRFTDRSENVALEFEFTFERKPSDETPTCITKGRGTATRLNRR
jgi:thiol-disulfide isomerase/thioredoxin